MPRFSVIYDELDKSEDPEKKWAVVDTRAAHLVVKYCETKEEAETTAQLYERTPS